MSDLGFIQEPTPGENVREFYRRQGETRIIKQVLFRLQELEEARLRYGIDLGFTDAQEVILALVDDRVAATIREKNDYTNL
jgi:hypothetical protein